MIFENLDFSGIISKNKRNGLDKIILTPSHRHPAESVQQKNKNLFCLKKSIRLV